jgi:hypothetical protein
MILYNIIFVYANIMNIDNVDRLSQLQPEILILISLELDLSDIFILCQSNKTLYNKLYLNKNLWYRKLYHDFGFYYDPKTAKKSPDIYYKFFQEPSDTWWKFQYQKNYKSCQLRRAIILGYLDIVKYMIELGADVHIFEVNPVMLASSGGHLDVVKYLAEKGLDIHACGDEALISACRSGHLDVVKYLIEQGADIHTFGDLAILWASRGRHSSVVNYLLKQMYDE